MRNVWRRHCLLSFVVSVTFPTFATAQTAPETIAFILFELEEGAAVCDKKILRKSDGHFVLDGATCKIENVDVKVSLDYYIHTVEGCKYRIVQPMTFVHEKDRETSLAESQLNMDTVKDFKPPERFTKGLAFPLELRGKGVQCTTKLCFNRKCKEAASMKEAECVDNIRVTPLVRGLLAVGKSGAEKTDRRVRSLESGIFLFSESIL